MAFLDKLCELIAGRKNYLACQYRAIERRYPGAEERNKLYKDAAPEPIFPSLAEQAVQLEEQQKKRDRFGRRAAMPAEVARPDLNWAPATKRARAARGACRDPLAQLPQFADPLAPQTSSSAAAYKSDSGSSREDAWDTVPTSPTSPALASSRSSLSAGDDIQPARSCLISPRKAAQVDKTAETDVVASTVWTKQSVLPPMPTLVGVGRYARAVNATNNWQIEHVTNCMGDMQPILDDWIGYFEETTLTEEQYRVLKARNFRPCPRPIYQKTGLNKSTGSQRLYA